MMLNRCSNIGTFPLLKYYLNNVYGCLDAPDVWKVLGETNTKYIYATNIAI